MFTKAETMANGTLPFCEAELDRLVREIDSAPSRTVFYDIGAVSEILILTAYMPAAKPMILQLRDAAAKWLRSGLLEDLLVAQAEFGYHVALLTSLAQDAESFERSDNDIIRALSGGRLIGRNEVPVVRQHLMAKYFCHCGIPADFGELGNRNLARFIDKRVLRARSDEFDLLVLLMCAQLIQLDPNASQQRPRTYPQVQLVQALRSGNTNWIPVLTLLCRQFFGLPDALLQAALKTLQTFVPLAGQLLPAPPRNQIDNEYIGRSDRGLRLRSTIALALLFASPGEINDFS